MLCVGKKRNTKQRKLTHKHGGRLSLELSTHTPYLLPTAFIHPLPTPVPTIITLLPSSIIFTFSHTPIDLNHQIIVLVTIYFL